MSGDPLYFIMGPDTADQRKYAETRLRSNGCSYAYHEPREGNTICSMGYTHVVRDGVCLIINHRTPVYAE